MGDGKFAPNETVTAAQAALMLSRALGYFQNNAEFGNDWALAAIRRATRFCLPFGKFYFSGVFGGGLVILSKWPIEESSFYRYPLNGRPTAFFRGDWFVGKGVASAKIRFGRRPRDVIEVFNTHVSQLRSRSQLAMR